MATTEKSDGSGETERKPDKPPSHVFGSIVVLLLCFLPFGLVALVYGLLVQTRWSAGDERGASRASDMAEKWMYGGVGAAILIIIGTVIWYFTKGLFSD